MRAGQLEQPSRRQQMVNDGANIQQGRKEVRIKEERLRWQTEIGHAKGKRDGGKRREEPNTGSGGLTR